METEEKTTIILPNDSSSYITSNNNTLGNYAYHTGSNTGHTHSINSIASTSISWHNNLCEIAIHGDIDNIQTEEDIKSLMSELTNIEKKVKARLEAIKGKKIQRRKLDI